MVTVRAIRYALMWTAILLATFGKSQNNLAIYTDNLRNGFLNWSWAPVFLSSDDYLHSGTYSAQCDMGAWQALCFYHFPMSTKQYESVHFWIHGGAVGGQRLYVQCQTHSGGYGPAYLLAPLLRGRWQEYTIPLEVLGMDNKTDFATFNIRDWNGTNKPSFYVDDVEFIAKPVLDTGNKIDINASASQRTIDERMFGVNMAVYYNNIASTDYALRLAEAGLRYFRFPGGFYTNLYHWQTNSLHQNPLQLSGDLNGFVELCNSLGAHPNISTNYGSGTAAEAAAWVNEMNNVRGLYTKYWDVGNENNGTNQPDFHARHHDPYTYAVEFKNYYNAMKAVDPTIKIGAVLSAGEDAYSNGYTDHPAVNPRTGETHFGWTPVVLSTLASLGITPDYAIFHRYAQGPGGESDEVLLSSGAGWAGDINSIRQMLKDYLGTAAAANIEITCGEHNSVYSKPGKQSVSLVNALFYAESFGNALQTELKGLQWWTFRENTATDGNMSPSLYGWRMYGGFGMLDDVNDPFPTLYGAEMASRFADAGDVVVGATSSASLLSAFAVKSPDNTLSIMIINKHPNKALEAELRFTGYSPQPAGVMWTYGIEHDEAARTGFGSRQPTSQALSIPRKLKMQFNPYSITVLKLKPGVKKYRPGDDGSAGLE